ncbi:hypothetical protein C7N43_03035 [Sphingobacteriales bacterium UPWRP_1]|nr:hypothetical protein BVG80_09535 [Sphingobacteriales bacterium TSM_CSM]PSJ78592.1 hypothetical protein C7N43_03035 [Sphingobacteriales bacterium UPWRP_1]
MFCLEFNNEGGITFSEKNMLHVHTHTLLGCISKLTTGSYALFSLSLCSKNWQYSKALLVSHKNSKKYIGFKKKMQAAEKNCYFLGKPLNLPARFGSNQA